MPVKSARKASNTIYTDYTDRPYQSVKRAFSPDTKTTAPFKKSIYHYSNIRVVLACIGTLIVINIALLNLYFEKLNSSYKPDDKETVTREIQRWEEIVKRNPSYRDGYLKLAILYWQLRDDERARQVLGVATELDPNSEKIKTVRKELEL